jgi:hypothetical protein
MATNDYWEKDELQDRLYHASKREKHYQHQSASHWRLRWPLRRSKTASFIFALLLLLWWSIRYRTRSSKADWSRFAYSQYTTDTQSLCNSVMVFASLHKLGSKADRVLMYPQEWLETVDDINWRLLHKAESKYRVKLKPMELLGADTQATSPGTLDDPSGDWDLSITKLRAFELVHYDRVLHLDSDITLLRHMDELFFLPKAPIAMPRAYWANEQSALWPFTSLIMLIEPDVQELSIMLETLRQWQTRDDYAKSKKYDMDLLNHRFGLATMALPHRPYAMLTAELRSHKHGPYWGSGNEDVWDPAAAVKEAKLVHFSDWPLPKPWVMWPAEGLVEMQPDCDGGLKETCSERELWVKLYDDFRRRRKNICKIAPVPAPGWCEWKKRVGALDPDDPHCKHIAIQP